MAARSVRPMAADPIAVGRARDLLDRADLLLENASGVEDDPERFRQLYLAALRGAGAALAIHEPAGRAVRRRTPNAWSRIARVVPDLAPHAEYFAELSVLRMNIEAGIERAVDPVLVAQVHRRVLVFLDAVEEQVVAYERGGAGIGSSSLAHPA